MRPYKALLQFKPSTPRRIVTRTMAQPARSMDFLANLPGVPVQADQLQVLFSARDYKARMLELISQAQHRIYIVALYLQEDDAGREILQALHQAKLTRPELDVKILVDFHRAQRGLIGKAGGGNHTFYQQMADKHQSGVEIYGVPVKGREFLGVLHLKGFVIDDTVLYSGASINDVYLHQQDRYRYDRYHQIESQELANSMADYLLNGIIATSAVHRLDQVDIPSAKMIKSEIASFKRHLRKLDYQFTASEGDLTITPLAGLGKKQNPLNNSIHHLLQGTDKSVFICTPYFNFPRSVTKDITQLLKRGVKITIVVGDKTANDFYIPEDQPFSIVGAVPYLYETILRKFAKRYQHFIDNQQLNIMLWKHDHHSFHLKGMFIDQRYAMITGNNLNPRAWGRDLENGLLINDKAGQLTDKFEQEQQQILTHSKRLDHYAEVDEQKSYPEKVQKLLKRVQRTQSTLILRNFL